MNLNEIKHWEETFQKYSKGMIESLNGYGTYSEIGTLGGTVLDVGCGSMEFLSYIKQSDSYLVGLDASRNALTLAKKESRDKNVSLVRGVAEHLPFIDNAFDKVLCVEVMHHLVRLDDCKRALKEMHRVSKSNVLLTFRHNDYKIGLEKLNVDPNSEGHVFFDESEINRMLEEAGFNLNRSKIFSSGNMWGFSPYTPWPSDLPLPETKAVVEVECIKI